MRSSLAVVLLVSLSACKGNETTEKTEGSGLISSTTGDDPFAKGLADLEALRVRMCACNDVPCTDKVFEEFKLWRVAIRQQNPGKRPSKEQEQKGSVIDRAMRACRANVTAKPGSAASGSAVSLDAALAELESFKSKMCACTDKACADGVQIDYATWQRNLRAKETNKLPGDDPRGKTLENEMRECRKKAETATPGAPTAAKLDDMLAQLESFRDKICACTAKDCAAKLQTEMQTWMEQVSKGLADAKPSKDQNAKAVRLRGEIKTCVGKFP